MDRALLLLIWLRARGAVRRMFRRVRGVRGALALAVGIILMVMWLLPSLVVLFRPRHAPTDLVSGGLPSAPIENAEALTIMEYGPLILMGMCLLPLLTGQALSLAFLPAEVDFLFAGPFTRRRLIGYKVLINALGAAAMAIFMGLWLIRMTGHWMAAYPVALLSLILTQLFGMLIAVAGAALGHALFVTMRKLLLAGVLIGCAAGGWAWFGPGFGGFPPGWSTRLLHSLPVEVLLAPFKVFMLMLTAASAATVAGWGLAALGVNAILFVLVVRMDRYATEAALQASERQAAMRERAGRGSSGAAPGWLGARWVFPWPLPPGGWLGGAGPIAWRQATTCLRGAPGWVISTTIMLACVVGFGMWTRTGRQLPEDLMGVIGTQVVFLLTIFQTVLLRFDFRADLDRMESIKALPLSPLSIAAGQLATPIAFMTVSQWLLAAAGAVMFPGIGWYLLAGAAAAPGVNTLLVGVENLMFLLYPTRPPAGPVFELQRIGRGTFVSLAKLAVVLLAGGVVAGVGAGAFYVTARSWPAAIAAAWAALAVVAWAVVIAVSRAFAKFDVSRDAA